MAISLTESAAERVRNRLVSRGRGLGLRIGVKASGCSGYSYVIDYADEAREDDRVFESQGVKVFVDGESLPTIDFVRLKKSFEVETRERKPPPQLPEKEKAPAMA